MVYYIFEDVSGEASKIKEELKKQGHEVFSAGDEGYKEKYEAANILIVSESLFCPCCHSEENIKKLQSKIKKWEADGRKICLFRPDPNYVDRKRLGFDKYEILSI